MAESSASITIPVSLQPFAQTAHTSYATFWQFADDGTETVVMLAGAPDAPQYIVRHPFHAPRGIETLERLGVHDELVLVPQRLLHELVAEMGLRHHEYVRAVLALLTGIDAPKEALLKHARNIDKHNSRGHHG